MASKADLSLLLVITTILATITTTFSQNCGTSGQWCKRKCQNRGSHWKENGHNYIYSGAIEELQEQSETVLTGAKQAELTAVVRSWHKARDYCKERCMDLVGLETESEYATIKDKMKEYGVAFVWTSGHACTREVDEKCYDPRFVPAPRRVNGWIWLASGQPMGATNKNPTGYSYNAWGSTGVFRKAKCSGAQEAGCRGDKPQPDNGEQDLGIDIPDRPKKFKVGGNGTEEACLAIAENLWEDGFWWNDIACWHKKAWICEDSDALLKEAGL